MRLAHRCVGIRSIDGHWSAAIRGASTLQPVYCDVWRSECGQRRYRADCFHTASKRDGRLTAVAVGKLDGLPERSRVAHHRRIGKRICFGVHYYSCLCHTASEDATGELGEIAHLAFTVAAESCAGYIALACINLKGCAGQVVGWLWENYLINLILANLEFLR